MLTIRRAEDRGAADHGWLDTRHTFSFADYYDEAHMGFRALRVINEDKVKPGQGFGTHPHRDMEIISWVLDGALAHKDSMGNVSVIKPGEAQRTSAGTGILHSEFNASRSDLVHFLQIWILPDKRGIAPSYEQKSLSEAERRGKLTLLAAPDAAEGSLTIHADARVHTGLFEAGESAELALEKGRHAWVHVARGEVTVNGERLKAGDGAALSDEALVRVEGVRAGEVVVFDLA